MRPSGLRVLLYMTVYETSPNLSGLSEWSHHLDIARALERAKAPVFLYVAVPNRSEKTQYDDSLFEMPNVKVLPYRFDGYYEMPSEWARWIAVYRNAVPFDIIWNDCWWHNLRIGVQSRESSFLHPPVINLFHEGPRAPELRVHHEGFPLVDLNVLGGFLHDVGVVLTEDQRRLLLQIGRERLSPASMNAIMERMIVLPPAVDPERVDRYRERFNQERRERKEMVVFLGGGLKEAKRQFPAIAEVVKRLRDRGLPIRLKVRTQSQQGIGCSPQLEALGADIEYGCSRSRYLEGLGDADVVIDATKDETTGLANIEAVLSGALLVAVRYPWMEGRIPDWYPFAVGSVNEMEPVLAMLIDKPKWETPNFKGIGEKLEQHFREQFSSDVVAGRFVEILRKSMKLCGPYRISPGTMELVSQAVGDAEQITMPELYKGMRQYAKSQAVDWSRGNKIWNGFVARRALEALGFVDLCDGPDPVFVKS